MPETKTKLTFRPHDWFNAKTGKEKFGIEVKPVGMEVRYAHCAEANKPLLFDTPEERDAKMKELRREQNRQHPPEKKRKSISIEITMNRLVADQWTIYCRRKPTDKEHPISLEFKKPVNGMQIVESVQNLQNEKGSQFSQFSLFKCIPTAEDPAKQQNNELSESQPREGRATGTDPNRGSDSLR